MADNTTLNPGAGGDVIVTEQPGGTGPKLCVTKIHNGALDVDGGNITRANPFNVESAAPRGWSVNNVPATAAQATVTQAAAGASTKNVCTSFCASVACGATAQTPILAYIRDGATGAGTVLFAAALSAPANSTCVVALSGLSVVGSANTQMTVEFSAAGVAASQETISASGYTTT